VQVVKCCGEIVDFCSLTDGEAGEIREKRRVCSRAARVGCDASKLQHCRRCAFVEREVARNEARGWSKRPLLPFGRRGKGEQAVKGHIRAADRQRRPRARRAPTALAGLVVVLMPAEARGFYREVVVGVGLLWNR
jgi:hypothetical protein